MTGHVITVAQQKGGSGKTTVSANLATGFLRQGKRVALVDIDPQGSLGRWFMTRVEENSGPIEDLEFATSSAWGITYEVRKLSDSLSAHLSTVHYLSGSLIENLCTFLCYR